MKIFYREIGSKPEYQRLIERTGGWERKTMRMYHRFIRSKRVFIKNEFRAREHWIWGQTAQDRSVAVPQMRCLDLDNLLNLSVLTYKSGKIIEPLHRSRYED